MDKSLIRKVKEILGSYKQNDSRIWYIGTNFYNSWRILCNTLKDNSSILKPILNLDETNKIVISDLILVEKIDKKTKERIGLLERYKMLLKGINITPITLKNKVASQGAIRQYLQVGAALGFVNKGHNFKPDANTSFDILPKLWNCLDEQNVDNFLDKNLYSLLIRSCRSCLYWERNIGYSLFLCLLASSDEKEVFNENVTHEITPRTSKSRKPFKWNDSNALNKIIELRDFEGTYTEACDRILKIDKRIIYQIIDEMYELIQQSTSLSVVKEQLELLKEQHELKQYTQKIEQMRGNLSKVIKEQRVNGQLRYTEFDNYKELHVGDLRACHIYQVKTIKQDITKAYLNGAGKIELDNIMNQTIDPANGLLMPSSAHDLYDDMVFGFKPWNGEMWIRDEQEARERVYNAFNITKDSPIIKIKEAVLSDKMKEYLQKRV